MVIVVKDAADATVAGAKVVVSDGTTTLLRTQTGADGRVLLFARPAARAGGLFADHHRPPAGHRLDGVGARGRSDRDRAPDPRSRRAHRARRVPAHRHHGRHVGRDPLPAVRGPEHRRPRCTRRSPRSTSAGRVPRLPRTPT
jgi:hypothetical protein